MVIQTRLWAHAAALVAGVIVGCAMPALDDDDVDDVVDSRCEAELDDSGCDLCLKTACCQAYATCVNEPDCNCVLGCASFAAAREDCERRCDINTGRVLEVVAQLEGGAEACDVQCGDRCRVFALTDDIAEAP